MSGRWKSGWGENEKLFFGESFVNGDDKYNQRDEKGKLKRENIHKSGLVELIFKYRKRVEHSFLKYISFKRSIEYMSYIA